jgi:hypothetical protein
MYWPVVTELSDVGALLGASGTEAKYIGDETMLVTLPCML